VLPTSTSNGADACIVVGINDIEELKNHKVYGLGSSVSEYCFNRNLELQGKNPADYQFTDKMPEEAASAMQTSPEDTKAIMVWNPFVLDTLRKVDGSKRMFDSSTIKGEIVDMVVVAKASLDKEGGENFACAVIDAFYQVSDMIENAESRDETLVLLAEKFAPDLKVDDMVQIVKETEFYKTPDLGRALYTSDEFKGTMDKVLKFCTDGQMVDRAPTLVYGTGDGDLRFDPTFMQKVQEKK
jgi:ABC-type nitrate/sulfonate/bicarbonate transport system substrate-binding protein